jgi:hypothetical protein
MHWIIGSRAVQSLSSTRCSIGRSRGVEVEDEKVVVIEMTSTPAVVAEIAADADA